jgi:DNA mismatch repair protein MutS2
VRVSVVSLDRDGTLESVEPHGRKATVRVGKLRVTVPVGDLRTARGGEPESPRPAPGARVRVDAERVAPDVVIVGCTVDEALARVDKALDRALLAGSDGFRVVHGHGTGALRQSIRAHLAEAPHVRHVRSEGGDAATWVDVG